MRKTPGNGKVEGENVVVKNRLIFYLVIFLNCSLPGFRRWMVPIHRVVPIHPVMHASHDVIGNTCSSCI